MFRLFLIAFIAIPLLTIAQGDTVYYSKKHFPSGRDSASILEVTNKLNDTDYYAATYSYPGGRLLSTNHYKTIEPPVYNGVFVNYYKNGDTVKGVYNMNMYTGESHDYYDKDEDTLRCTYNQKNGKLQGALINYYRNGKVKRRAMYVNDKPVQTHQYDEQGREVFFTPYMVMPEPMFNVNSYLARKIKYPAKARRNNIEGRVNVCFVVDEQGKVKDAIVVSDTDPLLNQEALRVVNGMKQWKPGIVDDVPVKVYFTLPVLFKLTD